MVFQPSLATTRRKTTLSDWILSSSSSRTNSISVRDRLYPHILVSPRGKIHITNQSDRPTSGLTASIPLVIGLLALYYIISLFRAGNHTRSSYPMPQKSVTADSTDGRTSGRRDVLKLLSPLRQSKNDHADSVCRDYHAGNLGSEKQPVLDLDYWEDRQQHVQKRHCKA